MDQTQKLLQATLQKHIDLCKQINNSALPSDTLTTHYLYGKVAAYLEFINDLGELTKNKNNS